MDEINYFLNESFGSIGGKVRNFNVDYRDADNAFFSAPATAMVPPGVQPNFAALTQGLIRAFEEKGFTVFCITELLDGCPQIEELTKLDPKKAREFIRPIYMDFRKEWS